MSIGPPIPEIQHFQSLTFKIQGQCHSSRSQSRYNILSTHIPFIPCQSALPFLGYSYFKNWSWKFKVKVMGEVKGEGHNKDPTFSRLTSLSLHVNHASHYWVMTFFHKLTLKIKGQGRGWGHSSKSQCGSNILSTHIPFVPCRSGIPFLSYDFFTIWPWKSRVKVMDEANVQSHNAGLTSYRLTSFFTPCHLALAFLRYSIYKIWPWKLRVKFKWQWWCTTTGLDKSIEFRMVQILPAVLEIWVPQSLTQVLPDLTSFLPMGKPIWRKWANNYNVAQLQV